jgi:predicted MFS family arabinose efflux permease
MPTAAPTQEQAQRERLLWVLSAATFIIFFQAYMVVPIIPALSNTFGASVQTVGLIHGRRRLTKAVAEI